MTRREPFFGPNAFVFALLIGFVVAVNYWAVPWIKSSDKPIVQPACAEGLPPPPAGFVVICD
jgi:hypothetical protein